MTSRLAAGRCVFLGIVVVIVQSLLTQTDDGDASILAIAVALPEALADEYASRLRLDLFLRSLSVYPYSRQRLNPALAEP